MKPFGGKGRVIVEYQFGAGLDPQALAGDVRAVAIIGRLDIEVAAGLDLPRVREHAGGGQAQVLAAQAARVGEGVATDPQMLAGLERAAIGQRARLDIALASERDAARIGQVGGDGDVAVGLGFKMTGLLQRAGVEFKDAALQPARVVQAALCAQRQQTPGVDAAAIEQGIGDLEFEVSVGCRDQAAVVQGGGLDAGIASAHLQAGRGRPDLIGVLERDHGGELAWPALDVDQARGLGQRGRLDLQRASLYLAAGLDLA